MHRLPGPIRARKMQITVGMVEILIGGSVMSWLDDMEPADPAYPEPDADPWSSPDYAPDTARGLHAEISNAIGEWARQQNAVAVPEQPDRPWLILDSEGKLLGDYRTKAERDRSLQESIGAGDAVSTSHWDPDGGYRPGWSEARPVVQPSSVPDWRALRHVDARAREAGLRASVPQPDRRGSPEYQADAAAWGTGRGIAPNGPEAGE
jgi:hypothetical protein